MTAPITKEQWAEARRQATEVIPGIVEKLGLPKALLGYQGDTIALLETTACRVLFVEKSRRIGETWALAAYAVLRAARQKRAGGKDALYISYSQEMTREFIDACAMWARAYSLAATESEEFLFEDKSEEGDRSIQAFRIKFARVSDLTVGTLLSIDSRMNRRAELTIEMRGVPGDEQKLACRMIHEAAPRFVGAAYDATGMGWTVAEDMGRLFGFREAEEDTGMVWAIKLNPEWYRINMPPLKVAFEDAAIGISKHQDHLTDLRLVKLIAGIPRVPDLRTGEPGKKRHGDFAIALALAHFASRLPAKEYAYEPATQSAARQDGALHDLPPDDDDRRNPYRQPLGASLRGSL